ncbi:DMT family protein [Terricaulis sp.]|uniref:DMT family protein n=1 Tax=Terricaulis sp. TaxID=2768686 RepID=UPI002AC5AD2F|nr:DMT family protein [Terricaulis sp.]MDZ4692577.1 DMT family protein [Terricaulis sp.]
MPSFLTSPQVAPILLLIASNIFMTFAWYGHLKFKSTPLLIAIVVAWGIAFIEYCLAVPANRIGSAVYSTAELKTMQEVITLVVFIGFSTLFLREHLGWNHLLGFALIALGAGVVFLGKAPVS